MGASYGGYATLVGLTNTPETFACGVDIVGPTNLVTLLKTIPSFWTPDACRVQDRIGDPTTKKVKSCCTISRRYTLSRTSSSRY